MKNYSGQVSSVLIHFSSVFILQGWWHYPTQFSWYRVKTESVLL